MAWAGEDPGSSAPPGPPPGPGYVWNGRAWVRETGGAPAAPGTGTRIETPTHAPASENPLNEGGNQPRHAPAPGTEAAGGSGGGGGGGGGGAAGEKPGGWYKSGPTITEQYQPLESSLRNRLLARFQGGSALPTGFAQNALRQVNSSFATVNQALQNKMANMGLYGGPGMAGAMGMTEGARAGNIANVLGSMPLLERQMENQDLGIASALISAFGRGQEGSSYGMTQSNSSSSGGGGGGGMDFAQYAALTSPLPSAWGAGMQGGLGGFGSF